MLGGGGYTIRNVARCWTYETATALNCDIANGGVYLEFLIINYVVNLLIQNFLTMITLNTLVLISNFISALQI